MPTHHLTADLLVPVDRIQDWSTRLADVGLLTQISAPQDGSPLADIAAVQDQLEQMLQAQALAEQTHTIELPDAVWWLVGGALLVIILFAEALVATLGPGAIVVGMALAIGTALFTLYDRNRRLADARVGQLEAQLRNRLQVVLAQNFVIRLGGAVLVSTPDLDALVLLADATAITDPDTELTERITSLIAQLQERVEQLIGAPGDWRRQDLAVDLDVIQQQLDALPPPVQSTTED